MFCYKLVHGTASPPDFCPLVRLVQDGKEHSVEMSQKDTGGKYLEGTFIVSASPLIGSTGNFEVCVHMLRDITEHKKMEEEAHQRNLQLIQSEKMASMGQLIAGIAHEINNPMMAVLGYSSELSRQARSTGTEREKIFEHLADDLDVVKEAAERCIEITHGLLVYSRTAASEKTKTDIHEIIDKTTALLASECRYHKIILDKKFECAEPTIYGNPTELQQVLTNLIINARDAMPKGGKIHIRTFTPKPNHVAISVKDTGSGIPKENFEKIFEPFFTTKPSGKSTGLGLSIVFGLVKSHNGDISMESETGRGTEFTITLPAYYEKTSTGR
jgi:signal transduction histidine kinase